MPGRTKARTRARHSAGSVRSSRGFLFVAVGQHDARRPLGRTRGLVGIEPAGEERCGDVAGGEEDPVELGEGQVGQDHPGLVGQQVGQGRVRPQPPRRLDHAGHEHVLEVLGLAHGDGQGRGQPGRLGLDDGAEDGVTPTREGPVQAWPGTGRPRGRCRRPWSWPLPGGPGSAVRRRRYGPSSRSGRRRRDAGRPDPAQPAWPGRPFSPKLPLLKQYGDFCLTVNNHCSPPTSRCRPITPVAWVRHPVLRGHRDILRVVRRPDRARTRPGDGGRPGSALRAGVVSPTGSEGLGSSRGRHVRGLRRGGCPRVCRFHPPRRDHGRAEADVRAPVATTERDSTTVAAPPGVRSRSRRYRRLVLETGTQQQPAAQQLYRSEGFRQIACWPPHDEDPTSVRFAKELWRG